MKNVVSAVTEHGSAGVAEVFTPKYFDIPAILLGILNVIGSNHDLAPLSAKPVSPEHTIGVVSE